MIGKVEHITRFGLFVTFSTDDTVSKKTGLMRWSAVPKGHPKYQIGDLVSFEISKEHTDGKIDLTYLDEDFKSIFGQFLEETEHRLEILKAVNKDLR